MWTRNVPWSLVRTLLAGRAALIAENLALRQQLAVLQRSVPRPKLGRRDRIFWVWLSKLWTGWRSALVVVQFPWDTVPRFLLRDRDGIYGGDFVRVVRSMGIEQVLIAPRSPWRNPWAERLAGSIRRECLDHVTVFNERHLQHVLRGYIAYYHRSRTHLWLAKDAPEPREIEPPERGEIVEIPAVGGLHHRYARRAA